MASMAIYCIENYHKERDYIKPIKSEDILIFLKICVAMKKNTTANHVRMRKYLKDTKGIEIAKEVMRIQKRLKQMAIETGCRITFLSNRRSDITLKKKRSITPIIRG